MWMEGGMNCIVTTYGAGRGVLSDGGVCGEAGRVDGWTGLDSGWRVEKRGHVTVTINNNQSR